MWNNINLHIYFYPPLSNNFYLVKDVSREYHVLTGMLFAHADDVWIDKKENLIRIIFFFQINDRVQK